jgi:hypothetical protein
MILVPKKKYIYIYIWASTSGYWDSLTFLCRLCSYLTGNTNLVLHGLLLGQLYFLDIRNSTDRRLYLTWTTYIRSNISHYLQLMANCNCIVNLYSANVLFCMLFKTILQDFLFFNIYIIFLYSYCLHVYINKISNYLLYRYNTLYSQIISNF